MLWAEVIRFDLAEDGLVRDALPKCGVRGIGTFGCGAGLRAIRQGRNVFAPCRAGVGRENLRSTNPWCPDRLQQPSYRALVPRTSTTVWMAIGVTRAALRLAPSAVDRSGKRRVRGFRSSLTQECEDGDPDCRRARGAFFDLYSQRRELPAWLNLRSFSGDRLHQLEGINATGRLRLST